MNTKHWLSTSIQCSAIKRRLVAEQSLFREGQQSCALYEIVSGRVKLAQIDGTGREVVLGFACAGDTIGEASLFSGSYRCDATAVTQTVVRIYKKSDVLVELQGNPKVALGFMARLAHRVIELRTRLERQHMKSARDRVRHYLAAHADAEGRTVILPGTVKDLAAEIGLSHEALYRTLSALAADGQIARLKNMIKIADASYDRDHR
jgi:CRP-like cAMP-binding protein